MSLSFVLLLPVLAFIITSQLPTSLAQCLAAVPGWEVTYAADYGVCLFTQVTDRGRFNYNQSSAICSAATASASGVARLFRPDTPAKRWFLFSYLMLKSFGYITVWTDAKCNVTSQKFEWSNKETVHQSCSNATQRLYLQFTLLPDNTPASALMVANAPDVSNFIPVCEYDVPSCNASSVPGYSSHTMSLSAVAYPNRTIRFNCAPGFYRESEIILDKAAAGGSAAAAAIASRNLYYCQFTPGVGAGVATFVSLTGGSVAAVEACESVNCKGSQLLNATQIPDAETSYRSAVIASKSYAFGEKIPVTCKIGYVSYQNELSSNTTVECGQSDLNPSLGMWLPPSLSVCSAVNCKDPMPQYNSDVMIAYKAYDRSKDRAYSSGESNRFPFYPNVVAIKCREDGYFFMDRKYDKALQCSLPNNGSRIIGVWTPVDGTILSSDVMGCKRITCRTNEVVIPVHQSDLPGALANANLNDTVTVKQDSGDIINMTLKEFSQKSDMTYNTHVRVYCQYLHYMSVTNSETGRIQMDDTYEVTCAPSGTWSNHISACIKRAESIMTAGNKKYVPPAKEAQGARSLGLVVIIILIVFFATVIILDLTTITRDIRLMKRNVSRLRFKWRQSKKQA